MPNKRIFYASHAVSVHNVLDPYSVTVEAVPGVQSVAINTNFNLENVFQLGRLAAYDIIPANPEVDITISKALDGRPLIWNYFVGDDAQSLVGSSNDQATITLHVGKDTDEVLTAVAESSIKMTGCYVTSLNYTFPVDGNFIEELSFIGNHKAAGTSIAAPPATPKDRILRKQNFRLAGEANGSTLPAAISGKCISNVTISADLNREAIFCLGSFAPYHRYINFPVEITVAFDVNQDGNPGTNLAGPNFNIYDVPDCSAPSGTSLEPIIIKICASKSGVSVPSTTTVYEFDLGSGSLQSVSYSGGDTGGGSVTETYTYLVYNTLNIKYTAPT